MEQSDDRVRRCRVVGVAYIDDADPVACEMNWVLDLEGGWSYELDWMSGPRFTAFSADPSIAAIIARIMTGPVTAPAPQPPAD